MNSKQERGVPMNSRALARIESLGAAPNPQEMKGTSRGFISLNTFMLPSLRAVDLVPTTAPYMLRLPGTTKTLEIVLPRPKHFWAQLQRAGLAPLSASSRAQKCFGGGWTISRVLVVPGR